VQRLVGHDPSLLDAQEVVRLLLGHPSAKDNINDRDDLDARRRWWWACYKGRGGVVKALLENGADPTTADKKHPRGHRQEAASLS
jgi:hypothetical protein